MFDTMNKLSLNMLKYGIMSTRIESVCYLGDLSQGHDQFTDYPSGNLAVRLWNITIKKVFSIFGKETILGCQTLKKHNACI